MTDIELQDFSGLCLVCSQRPPDYLVVWKEHEEWRCDECFVANLCCIANRAQAVYYLPTRAKVHLTIHSIQSSDE